MTISSESRLAGPFVGNDVTTALPFTFKVFAAADLLVVVVDTTTGEETELELTTDYSVSLNGDQDANPGGTVTLVSPLPTGTNAIVTSAIGYLQETLLTNQGGFYPRVINDALDRLTIQVQQIRDQVARAVKVPITRETVPDEYLEELRQDVVAAQEAAEDAVEAAADVESTLEQFNTLWLGAQGADPSVDNNGDPLLAGAQYFNTAVARVKYFDGAAWKTAYGDAADVTFTPEGSGAVATTVAEALKRRFFNVKDFGALGDGVADDTDAIQKAIDAASVHTYGGTVFFPRGVYKVTGTLEVAHHYITLEGEGMNAATLQRDFATGYTVDFSRGGATDTIFYGQVLNLTFDTTVAMSSGAHLRLNVARLFRVANCRFSNGWIGIAAISVGDVLIDNCTIVTGTMYPTGGSEAYAYLVFDTDASANNPRNGAYVRHCNFRSRDDDDGHVLYGIVVTSADGIWFDQVHVGNSSSNNVFITPKTGTTQLSGLKFSGCWFDQNGAGRGVSIEGATSAVYGFIWFDDCYFTGGTNGTVALRVTTTSGVVRQVFLTNCLIINYTSSGLQFGNCEDFAVTGCVLRNVGSGGGAHGIQVFAACKNFRIVGNSSGYKTDVSTTSGAGYGLVIASGADGYIVTNNDLRGNATGGISDSGGPNKVVDNNLS